MHSWYKSGVMREGCKQVRANLMVEVIRCGEDSNKLSAELPPRKASYVYKEVKTQKKKKKISFVIVYP